jgi:hypothetical protein
MNDLIKHEGFLVSELEPREISDILLEEDALSVTDHDNIEMERSRRRGAEILLTCLKRPQSDVLKVFEHALIQSKKDYILERFKTQQADKKGIPGK